MKQQHNGNKLTWDVKTDGRPLIRAIDLQFLDLDEEGEEEVES